MSTPRRFSLPPNASVPLIAVFDISELAAFITFDQDVQPPSNGSWNTGTFTIHQPTRWYQAGIVTRPSANVIRVTAINFQSAPGSAVIDYDDALSTIVGANGVPVASFTGFPCPSQP